MKIPLKSVFVVYCLFAFATAAFAESVTKLYEVTFDSPHTVGQPLVWGNPEPVSNVVSDIYGVSIFAEESWYCAPIVVESVGAMTDRPCLFEISPDAGSSEIGFDIDKRQYSYSRYSFELDVLIDALIEDNDGYYDFRLRFSFDSLDFSADGNIYLNELALASYSLNEVIHIKITVDIVLQQFDIEIDGQLVHSESNEWVGWMSWFNISLDDVYQLGNKCAVDNIVISGINDEPELHIKNPYPGDGFTIGKTSPITWYSSDDVGDIDIEYSTDTGTTWLQVSPPNVGNTGSYDWAIPNTPSYNCLLKLSDASTGLESTSSRFRICEAVPALPAYEIIYLDEIYENGGLAPVKLNDHGDMILGDFYTYHDIMAWVNHEFVAFDGYRIQDINNQGQLLMTGINTEGTSGLFKIWQNGAITHTVRMDEGGYMSSEAVAMNEYGNVTGYYNMTDTFLWTDANGIQDLGIIENYDIHRTRFINDDNHILVECTHSQTSKIDAALWDQGQWRILDMPEIRNTYLNTYLNNLGAVAGFYEDTDDYPYAPNTRMGLWKGGEHADLGKGRVRGFNDTDMVLAEGYDRFLDYPPYNSDISCIIHGAERFDLERLANLPDYSQFEPRCMNNLGWVGGMLFLNVGPQDYMGRPVLLVPQTNRILTDILVTGPDIIYADETVSFRAIGVHDDNCPKPLTDLVTWTVSPEAAGVIEPNGVFYAADLEGISEIQVTAEYGEISVSEVFQARGPLTLRVPSEYPTIQSAIDAAIDGDTVLVADGTYTGDGNRDIDFLGKAITVKSQNGPETCIVDCQGTDEEQHRGFVFQSGETHNSVLSGFSVINGYAPWIQTDPDKLSSLMCETGGAIYCKNSSPVIKNCSFRDNAAWSVKVENAGITITLYGGSGGAIACNGGQVLIQDCTFDNNRAITGAGAVQCSDGQVDFINCKIMNNPETWIFDHGESMFINSGGAVTGNDAELHFHGCYFNKCAYSSVQLMDSIADISNCMFVGNQQVSLWAGVIDLSESQASVSCCTFIGNRAFDSLPWASWYGSLSISCDSSNLIIEDSILRDGEVVRFDENSNVVVNYSCLNVLDPNLLGMGNIEADPLFVDPSYWDPNGTPDDWSDDIWHSGDYHLKSEGWRWDDAAGQWAWDEVTSPCIDAGNPGMALGAEPVVLEVDPLNRWGENVRVNMGAYGGTAEASMAPPGWMLLCDLDNSLSVNLADFVPLAETWQTTAPDQPADVTRDGAVGLDDLAQFAGQWLATANR